MERPLPLIARHADSSQKPTASPAPNDRLIAGLLVLLVLGVYTLTMCRTIYSGDDGDFITCMATWGNSHPTGYPIFLLLGRLFLWLLAPVFSEPAARINWMTVLFGSIAVGFFYRFLVTGVRVERFWAAAGSLLLAFAPTLWQQSLSCEVYSLTALYLAALLYVASVWRLQPENTRLLRGMALLYGLATTNHLTIVLFLPGFLIFALYHRPALLRREGGLLASLVGLYLLPLLSYAYLPLAAKYGHSPLNWGDPETPALFWAKISGVQYHGQMFTSLHAWQHGIRKYGGLLWEEFRPWTLWLLPIGTGALWRSDRPLCALLLYVWAANVAFASNYSIVDVYVYYIPSYLVAAAFITAGASALLRWLWDRTQMPDDRRAHYTPLIAAVVLLLPLVHMSLHYAATDESGNRLESDFSANVVASAPPHALVLVGGMEIESIWYRRFVLGERRDIAALSRELLYGIAMPHMRWYYDQVGGMYPDLYNTYPGRRFPTFTEVTSGQLLVDVIRRALHCGVPVLWVPDDRGDYRSLQLAPTTYAQLVDRNFDRVPWGMGERLYLKGQAPGPDRIFAQTTDLWSQFRFHDLAVWAHQDPQQDNIPRRYRNAMLEWARLCERERRYDLAVKTYALASQVEPADPEILSGFARSSAVLAAAQPSAAVKERP